MKSTQHTIGTFTLTAMFPGLGKASARAAVRSPVRSTQADASDRARSSRRTRSRSTCTGSSHPAQHDGLVPRAQQTPAGSGGVDPPGAPGQIGRAHV